MTKPLTLSDAVNLEMVLNATRGDRRVARLIEDKLYVGEATNITDAHGHLHPHDADVRDSYLRVVGPMTVHYWPVSALMDEVPTGHFVPDYRDPA